MTYYSLTIINKRDFYKKENHQSSKDVVKMGKDIFANTIRIKKESISIPLSISFEKEICAVKNFKI